MIANKINFFSIFLTRKLSRRSKFQQFISVKPLSDVFGLDRGTPLDRVFIDRFLCQHREIISGDCLEVEESLYTRKFGQPGCVANVLKYTSTVGGSEKCEIVADLTQPESVPKAKFDTFICTQTLNFIFDLNPVIVSIHKLLKPGGYALITVAGISQISRYDYERWGDYWRFTDQSLLKLLSQCFDESNCIIESYGNVATACLFLQGFAYEDIHDKSILDVSDNTYPVIISATVRK